MTPAGPRKNDPKEVLFPIFQVFSMRYAAVNTVPWPISSAHKVCEGALNLYSALMRDDHPWKTLPGH